MTSHGFGRVIRALDGSVREIVEEAQATAEQLAIRELNVGAYCFMQAGCGMLSRGCRFPQRANII